MNMIRYAIDRPIAVVAAVLMVVMFGAVALGRIPIQLAPDINRPIIVVSTNWPGVAPAEIEREIVNRQEEVLKGLEGLEEMVSSSRSGQARITLTFSISTDMDRALLLTANRLDRVSGYPAETDEPTLATADSDGNAIAWFALTLADPERIGVAGSDGVEGIHVFGEFIDDVIRDRIERVEGVAAVGAFGGSTREMRIIVDPRRLARYQLTIPQFVASLRAANISLSAGDIEEGKRRYVVRTQGEFETIAQVDAVLVRSASGVGDQTLGRVTVGDIAEVRFAFPEPRARIRYLGQPALALNAQRETGANVIEVMAGIRAAVADLNTDFVAPLGLVLTQVYDETIYINSAIDLVRQNILIGGTLAAIILLFFLRSLRATLVISLAIPVSVIGSFVAMAALGRSINVISLAGIAFAVGMVVDAAIVVLENIYRLRQTGMSAPRAAYQGACEVWGAVLVSAMTTVLVFVPILVMELEVGQLFRDIAVAIAVSVLLSLLVSVTVIPALASRLLMTGVRQGQTNLRLPLIDWGARTFAAAIMAFTRLVVRRRLAALSTAVLIGGGAVAAIILLMPKLEYLPDGNRNFVFGVILPPPGYNLATSAEIARGLEGAVSELWAPGADAADLPPDGPPLIGHFFFVSTETNSFVGASAVEEGRAGELIPILRGPLFREPGTFGFMRQASLFGRGIGGSRSIALDVGGGDLVEVLGVALRATGMIAQVLPREAGNQFRPIPGLELGAPEVRVIPDPVRLADAGVTALELGTVVDAFNDGVRIAQITVGGDRLDLILRGPVDHIGRTQDIGAIPVVTPGGVIVSVDSLADIRVTSGPTQIRHKERERTVTLEIVPAPDIPLERALEIVETDIIAALTEQGLPPGVTLRVSGTADKLSATWAELRFDLLIAMAIVYLVMAVLFESFLLPLVIMISVPVAAAGGFAGLAILNRFVLQPLDMLTMLGFVILVGIVVNNAILIVHQTLHLVRLGDHDPRAAIIDATRNRIRPIFMSTLTSLFGMIPLVIFPGAGAELYRGLGSVVLGGLSLSALLTLLVVPPLLSLFSGALRPARSRLAAPPPADQPAPAE